MVEETKCFNCNNHINICGKIFCGVIAHEMRTLEVPNVCPKDLKYE